MSSQSQIFIFLVCLLSFVSNGLALDNEKEVQNLFDKRFNGLRQFTAISGRHLDINPKYVFK